MEQAQAQVEKNFENIGAFLTKLTPLLDLSAKIEERQKAAAENPQPAPAAGGLGDLGGMTAFLPQLMQMFGGGGGGSDRRLHGDSEGINESRHRIHQSIEERGNIENNGKCH